MSEIKDLCKTCLHCVFITKRRYDHKFLYTLKQCWNRDSPRARRMFIKPVTSCDFYFPCPHLEPMTAKDIEIYKVLKPLIDRNFLWSKTLSETTYILPQANFIYKEQVNTACTKLKKEVNQLAEEKVPDEISIEEFMTLEEKAPIKKGKTSEGEVLGLITGKAVTTSKLAKSVNVPNGITYSAMWSRLTRLLKAGKVARKYREGKAFWMAKPKATPTAKVEEVEEEVPEEVTEEEFEEL